MEDCKFYLTEEKLDELFVKEVDSVTKLVSELPNRDLIMPTCIRWFQIFQQSSADEKFARNCMLLEMHKQLNNQKTLGYPFTDGKNCNIDLSKLHQISIFRSKSQLEASVDNEDDSQTHDSGEWGSMATISSLNLSRRLDVGLETANRQLFEENSALTIELQEHQLKYKRLQQRQQKNLKIIKSLTDENKYFDKELGYIKQIFCWSAITSTKLLASALTETPQYFVTLFSVLCETKEDMDGAKELDKQFKKLIDSHINNFLRKKRGLLLQRISKEYDTLRATVSQRYKKVLRLQQTAQEKELFLMAMRYLTLLRMIFLSSYKGSKTTKKATLKFIHERYSEVAQDL